MALVDLTGGGSGNITIQPITGTTPVGDVITMQSSDASIGCDGNSATDALDWTVKTKVTGTRASPTLIAAAGTISVSAIHKQVIRVAGNAAPVNATMANGTIDGQEVVLVGCSDSNSVTVTGAGINGSRILILRSTLRLIWDNGATEWVDDGGNFV